MATKFYEWTEKREGGGWDWTGRDGDWGFGLRMTGSLDFLSSEKGGLARWRWLSGEVRRGEKRGEGAFFLPMTRLSDC